MTEKIVWEARGNHATATVPGFKLTADSSGLKKYVRLLRVKDGAIKEVTLIGIVGAATAHAEGYLRDWQRLIEMERRSREEVVDCVAHMARTTDPDRVDFSQVLYAWGQAVQDEREPLDQGPSAPGSLGLST